jgi:hypothetical protein
MLTRTNDDLYLYATVEGPGVGIDLVVTMRAVGLQLAIAGLYGLGPGVSQRHPRTEKA